MNLSLRTPSFVSPTSVAAACPPGNGILCDDKPRRPFAGFLGYDHVAKVLQTVKTKKAKLLFVALFLRLFKLGH